MTNHFTRRLLADQVLSADSVKEAIADQALSLIEVDYEVLPHVIDVDEAMKPDAPLLFPDLITRGVEPWRIFAQYMGREDGPTRGRDGNVHMADSKLGMIAMVSHLPAMLPVAVGFGVLWTAVDLLARSGWLTRWKVAAEADGSLVDRLGTPEAYAAELRAAAGAGDPQHLAQRGGGTIANLVDADI